MVIEHLKLKQLSIMADVQVTSPKYSINWHDVIQGGIIAVIMAVMTTIEEAVNAGSKIDWTVVGGVAVGALVSYLAKKFFTGATVVKPVANDQVAEIKAANKVDLVVKP